MDIPTVAAKFDITNATIINKAAEFYRIALSEASACTFATQSLPIFALHAASELYLSVYFNNTETINSIR